MILQDILHILLLYMFCKKGHEDIAKHSINEDQSSTEETGKIGTTVQCIYLYHRLFLHQSPVGFILGQAEKEGRQGCWA